MIEYADEDAPEHDSAQGAGGRLKPNGPCQHRNPVMVSTPLYTWLLAALLLAGTSGVSAQVLDKKVLTLAAAKKIVAAAEAEAQKRKATVVIAVVDDGGSLVLLQRLDDTQVAS